MPHAAVSPRQRSRAKQLPQAMTRAETLLWRYLKANRIDGLGFRRQVPIPDYIADFLCMSSRLIIELDGPGEQAVFTYGNRSGGGSDQTITWLHRNLVVSLLAMSDGTTGYTASLQSVLLADARIIDAGLG